MADSSQSANESKIDYSFAPSSKVTRVQFHDAIAIDRSSCATYLGCDAAESRRRMTRIAALIANVVRGGRISAPAFHENVLDELGAARQAPRRQSNVATAVIGPVESTAPRLKPVSNLP